MKRTIIIIPLFLLLLSAKKTEAQTLSLSVSYTSSEKSRDSHSTKETFSLAGKNLSYAITYSGRKGPGQIDEEKKCVLTDEQINKISTTLRERKLNVEDSLIVNSSNSEPPYTSETITITVTKGSKATKIKVKGTYTQLTNKTLYTNSLYLIAVISKMLKACS